MKHIRKFSTILLALALLAGQLVFTSATPAKADPVYTCLPTCEENDARMLSIAGAGLETLADESIELQIAVEGTAPSFELSIFDGDTSTTWDYGSTPLKFSLYADPLAQGSQNTLIGEWFGNTMPDNQWFTASFPTTLSAKSPSGNYFYFLQIQSTISGTQYYNNFKVRTDGLLLTFRPSPFAFMAPLPNLASALIIYPQLPSLTTTTYDGNFTLYFYLSQSTSNFITWDGDLDHGSYDKTSLDTNDLDTPDIIPDWTNSLYVVPEDVAVGYIGSTGNPNDDSSSAFYRRSPSVIYSVTDPTGSIYANQNPSGNREWEKFEIAIDSNTQADYHISELLSAGVYKITLQGMDLGNLNAWRSLYPMMGVCPASLDSDPLPCKAILYPFIIGDTIYYDANLNGLQDPGEPGIPGVIVNLLDENGYPILDNFGNPITAVSNSQGYYQFEVEGQKTAPTGEIVSSGVYTLQVASANFEPGGVLYGNSSTTGGNLQTNTVIAASVLTYDFGYASSDSIYTPGTGTIGYWKNHPEAWPVSSITIGNVEYTQDQAIALMNTPGKGDKTYDLFAQLVAAKLNVSIGNLASCISADILAADAWLAQYPLGSKVKASSAEWLAIATTFTILDAYNNGLLCAPHRQ